MLSLLHLFTDDKIEKIYLYEMQSHMLHKVLCLECVAKMNKMFHTKRLVKILLIGLCTFVMFILPITPIVKILVCSGDFNKHYKHKLITSRDLRVTLEQKKRKERNKEN